MHQSDRQGPIKAKNSSTISPKHLFKASKSLKNSSKSSTTSPLAIQQRNIQSKLHPLSQTTKNPITHSKRHFQGPFDSSKSLRPTAQVDETDVNKFFQDNPELQALVDEVQAKGSLKYNHDAKVDSKTREHDLLSQMPNSVKESLRHQHIQEEEAFLDTLLYDNQQDNYENNLKSQHQQLRNKQQLLQQQRVINMNEFIRPPAQGNPHIGALAFQEIRKRPSGVSHRDQFEENQEHLLQQQQFEEQIQTQRKKIQQQLTQATKEEDSESIGSVRLEQQRKRAGPADSDDFLKAHGLDLSGLFDPPGGKSLGDDNSEDDSAMADDSENASTMKKNQQTFRKQKLIKGPLFGQDGDSTGGEGVAHFTEDDDDELDDPDQNPELDQDINAILSRQYMPSPFSYLQGISYDGMDENGNRIDPNQPIVNKHGKVIDPHFLTPNEIKVIRARKAQKKRLHQQQLEQLEDELEDEHRTKKLIHHHLNEQFPDVPGSEEFSELDEEDVGEDPVKDFVFPDKTDPLARSQSSSIPARWRFRVLPILDILEDFVANPKGHTSHLSLLQGLDTAARLLLELSARSDLPDIPRQVFATIINIIVPKQRTIKGIPISVSRPVSASIGPFLLLVMSTAAQNGIKFSDVEWQWVLNSIAQTSNIVNNDDVKVILEDAIKLFRQSQVIRGVRLQRDRSTGPRVHAQSPAFTRKVLITAPNVRLIEQRAWVEFYAYSHNRDLLLPFTRIHDSVVYKPSTVDNHFSLTGFIAEHIGEDIMSRPDGIDYHRVDEFDEEFESLKLELEGLKMQEDFDITNPSALIHQNFDPSKIFFPDGRKRRHKYAHYNDSLHNSLTSQTDLENLDPMTTSTPHLNEDTINARFEKAAKSWVSPDHHPQLYNYPDTDTLAFNGFMAAPDDILTEPWLYQPPHFGDQYLPRMCGEFRHDNLAYFPACITVMSHFTAHGTADLVQAEQFYKYTLHILMNTDGYYRAVLKELKTIDKYRTLHGYEPAEDVQMAQNMEAPPGEEFRYFASYPLIDGTDFTAWRARATQAIITMTKQLAKLYKREGRGTQIHNLIQFLFEKKRTHPSLIPIPSLALLQQYFLSSIQSRDIAQARQTVKMMMEMRRMVSSPKDDPLLQVSLQTFKNSQDHHLTQLARINDEADDPNAKVTGTNRRFADKTFQQNSDLAKEFSMRAGQSSFDSLQRELDMAVVIAQAALYAATNNFVALMELIQSLTKSANEPSHSSSRANNPEYHDLIHSLEHISPQTRTRIFRVIISFLATSSDGNNAYSKIGTAVAHETRQRVEKIYFKLKRDFDTEQAQKYPPTLVDELTQEDQKQFYDLQQQLFSKRVRDMIQPIYDELLTPTPLVDFAASLDHSKTEQERRITSTSTLRPGHIIWLFHQAQRHGASITPRLINDTLALLCIFPGEIGSYAAYHFVNDMLGLGFRINRPTLTTLSSATLRQAMIARPQLAKLYSNVTMNQIYLQLQDTTVTIPQLLDAGQTELPSIFTKEFSFLHPATITSLAKNKRIPLSASIIQNTLGYFAYTRNWVAAVESFRNAMDIAYYGNYAVTKNICKAQRISLSQLTDALPIKQRNIAFQARRSLFASAASIGHYQLVFDLLADWQVADGIKILPYRFSSLDFSTSQNRISTVKGANSLGDLKSLRLFPLDEIRSDSFKPLAAALLKKKVAHVPKNVEDDAPSTTSLAPMTPEQEAAENELQIAESISKLSFDQQKLLLQTVTKIKRNKQPPISQHFNLAKRSRVLHDVFDIALLSHDLSGAPWQRRYMEFVGVSPAFKTITKVLTTALSLSFKSRSNPPGYRVMTHIASVNASNSFKNCLPKHSLFSPSLPITTPITSQTNPQLGISVGYADNISSINPDASTALDDFQFKQSQLVAAIETSWDSFVTKVQAHPTIAPIVKSRILSLTPNDRHTIITNQLYQRLQKYFLPNHYSSIQEHTLTIKSAAQRLLDHYPFESANDAIAIVCNSRVGLGDFGIEYEPHKTPFLTAQLAEQKRLGKIVADFDPLNISKPISSNSLIQSNPRALSQKLQQHQRSYQNMSKMKHQSLILPLSLMIDSPALHIPGLALYAAEPRALIDDAEDNSILASHVKFDPITKSFALRDDLDVKDFANKLTGFNMVKKFNLMIGTEHIDSTLTEMFWRGLTITPFHVFNIVRSLFDQHHRARHVPQIALPTLPYISALTHNMDIFPLLDRSHRPYHGLSSTNVRQHHTLDDAHTHLHNELYKTTSTGDIVNETEERIVSTFSGSQLSNNNTSLRTDNAMITLNKIKGQFVVYQHEVVQLQLDSLLLLASQFHILSQNLSTAINPSSFTNNLSPSLQKSDTTGPYKVALQTRLNQIAALPTAEAFPYPNIALVKNYLTKKVDIIPLPNDFNTISFVSQLQDHFHGVDILIRRLTHYLPPQDSKCSSIGWFSNEDSVTATNSARGIPITDEKSIKSRSEYLLKSVLLAQNASSFLGLPDNEKHNHSYHPIVPDLQLPQKKPSNFPKFYNQQRSSVKVDPTFVAEIPDLRPKQSNYTESVLHHTNFNHYDSFVNIIAELPLYKANINSIILNPRFIDSSLPVSHIHAEHNMVSNCFDFTPRTTSNNKQNQLLLMVLFRYRQPSSTILQHITNWHDESQHILSQIHTAFSQIYGIDLSNDQNRIAGIEQTLHQRTKDVLSQYSKQPLTTSSIHLVTGLIDIAKSTLPTRNQLTWLDTHLADEQVDAELLHNVVKSEGESSSRYSPDKIQHIETSIQQRFAYIKSVRVFIDEMDSCLSELAFLESKLPIEAQFTPSTYTSHVTLAPAPYQPEVNDSTSQSYKLWIHETLSTLQSARLAPNDQQLAVLANTGPLINFKMFDQNYLTHHFKTEGGSIQNDLLYASQQSIADQKRDAERLKRSQLFSQALPIELAFEEEEETETLE